MKQKLKRQPGILYKAGKPVGTMYAAMTNTEDSSDGVISISGNDEGLLDVIDIGALLCVASSNDSANVLFINGNKITMDKPIFSANDTFLKKGEIIMLKDEDSYQ